MFTCVLCAVQYCLFYILDMLVSFHSSRSAARLLKYSVHNGSRSFSKAREPRIAIVGSGPAGLFTCASILRRTSASVDVFDASPVPFGLVRYGVAPDHQEVKNCIHGFDKMFESNRERLSLFCNVRIGKDVSFEELTRLYDGVLLAYGAHVPRRLRIPGADASNVMSGSDFVSWYNGVPGASAPMLDTDKAIIVGNGNVALDCARVLSAGSRADSVLRTTDVPLATLDVLEKSNVSNIKILGRRGPNDISFTVKELREQFKVTGWNTTVFINNEELAKLKESISTLERKRKRLLQVLIDGVATPSGVRQCQFLFHRVPEEIIKDDYGRVKALRINNRESGAAEEIPCGLLIYSIGYDTIVLDGVPKNAKGMIDMMDDCRVRMADSSLVYATGWCAHGAKGVIVDTQQQSTLVADRISKELTKRTDGTGASDLLRDRNVSYVSWNKWKEMDADERLHGEEKGKVREKITKFDGYINRM